MLSWAVTQSSNQLKQFLIIKKVDERGLRAQSSENHHSLMCFNLMNGAICCLCSSYVSNESRRLHRRPTAFGKREPIICMFELRVRVLHNFTVSNQIGRNELQPHKSYVHQWTDCCLCSISRWTAKSQNCKRGNLRRESSIHIHFVCGMVCTDWSNQNLGGMKYGTEIRLKKNAPKSHWTHFRSKESYKITLPEAWKYKTSLDRSAIGMRFRQNGWSNFCDDFIFRRLNEFHSKF